MELFKLQGKYNKGLTLKGQAKFVADNIRIFFLLFFWEYKSCHFMWIVCQPAIHMKCQDFSLKKKKKNCRLLQLWLVL